MATTTPGTSPRAVASVRNFESAAVPCCGIDGAALRAATNRTGRSQSSFFICRILGRMVADDHADISALEQAFERIEHDARALLSGLTGEQGIWLQAPGSWSIAECLYHLATSNRVYLPPMEEAAARARR